MALRLTDDEKTVSPDIYEDIDLVIYARTQNKTNPKPYVAALFTSGGNDNTFILGDGRITDDPTTRTANDYFNGPLEPGVTYKIFQRIIINKEVAFREKFFLFKSFSNFSYKLKVLHCHANFT